MPKRGHGDGSIRQRPDGRWEARYTNPETGLQKSIYEPTREAARTAMHAELRRLEQGLPPSPVGRVTTGTWLSEWLSDVVKPTLAPQTYRNYLGYFTKHIEPEIGKIPLKRLTHVQIQKFLNSRLSLERPLAPRSIRQIHMILSSALHYAEETGVLAHNPARLARHPRIERYEPAVLNLEQARTLINALAQHYLGPLYLLAATTGFRQGELLGLSWSDVDLDTGRILISHQLDRNADGWVLRAPKTETSRRLQVLPSPVRDLLQEHQQRQEALCAGLDPQRPWQDLIFTTSTGRPYHGKYVDVQLTKLCAELKLPKIRFHDLRHSCASLLIQDGAQLKDVSRFLGHSQIGITADTYVHLYEDHAVRMSEHVKRAFFPDA